MISSNLCDYSDAYILVSRTIKTNKKVDQPIKNDQITYDNI